MSQLQYGRLDGIAITTLSAFVGGALSAYQSLQYARGTGRVAHFVLGDSNAFKDEYGFLGGLLNAFKGRGQVFGSGLFGAKHSRAGTTRSNSTFWSQNNNNDAANFSRNYFTFSGASWNHGTLTLTGTFTGFTGKAGDRLTVIAGTNATVGDYVIASGNTTTIVLTTSIGASATTGIGGYLAPAAGTTSFSSVPQDFHDAWNIPIDWLPMGAAMCYHGSGNHGFTGNSVTTHKYNGALPCQGPIIYSMGHLGFTSGANTAVASIGHFDGTASLASVAVLATATINSTGTNGELKWTRASLAKGDRQSGHSGREYFICGTETALVNGAYCFLISHICAGSVTKGVSVQGFLCKGGESAYDIARTLNFLSDDTVDNYLRGLADQCSVSAGGTGARRAHAWVFTGFNDHGEGNTSLGPNPTLSSTAAGYIDNITAIWTRLKARWEAVHGAGTAATELFLTVVPSHPVSDTPTTPGTGSMAAREGLTRTYVAAAKTYANNNLNVSAVDLAAILGTNPFSALYDACYTFANSGVPASDDILHLNPGGYNFVMGKVLDTLMGV